MGSEKCHYGCACPLLVGDTVPNPLQYSGSFTTTIILNLKFVDKLVIVFRNQDLLAKVSKYSQISFEGNSGPGKRPCYSPCLLGAARWTSRLTFRPPNPRLSNTSSFASRSSLDETTFLSLILLPPSSTLSNPSSFFNSIDPFALTCALSSPYSPLSPLPVPTRSSLPAIRTDGPRGVPTS